MIPFNIFGHTNVFTSQSEDPIVWVDAQDISTYTLSGNDVTNLDNKGTLGGVMTLVGSVKFANNGFESWSVTDFISRDLGEPFLTNNSFTFSTTFNLQNITSGSNSSRNWFTHVKDASNSDRLDQLKISSNFGNSSSSGDNDYINYSLGLHTLIISYDLDTNTLFMLNDGGVLSVFNSVVYSSSNNTIIQLLSANGYSPSNSGQDNPLHEFRLYNRAMSLVEMQDLQTELNDKYLILGNELVVNGDFSNGLNGWNDNSGGTISIVNEKLVCNSSSGTFIFQSGLLDSSKMYKFTFEVTNYVSGTVYARSSPVNGVQYEQNGVYSDIIQGGNNKSLGGFNFTGTIDNISVKEILN